MVMYNNTSYYLFFPYIVYIMPQYCVDCAKDKDKSRKQAVYGYSFDKRPTKCRKHKDELMINLTKRCKYPGCDKNSSYAYPSMKSPQYCVSHKEENMIYVKVIKTCICCNRQASYGYITGTTKTSITCGKHKFSDMIDVKHKLCLSIGCCRRPSFNNEGEIRPLYCSKHKLDGMIDIAYKKRRISTY
jgi:hypothetical protein